MSAATPRRSPKPQDRQRDPERTRKLILDAAIAEFAAHGYQGARLAAIAARAGVNQQLISYYFDGKEGLYESISTKWRERQAELAAPETPLPDQLRAYALEALNNPAGVRLLAWSGLEYTGPAADPDHIPRAQSITPTIEHLESLRVAGHLPPELDPACLLVMLMAAAMAPTTLPHVIEGVTGTDPGSPEFITHYAQQLALLATHLGLSPTAPPTR